VDAGPERRLYSGQVQDTAPTAGTKPRSHEQAQDPVPLRVSWVAQTTPYAHERPAHRGKR
jgi:hypothetical protein